MKAETKELIEKFQSISGFRRYSIAYAIIAIEFAINVLYEAGIEGGIQLDELEEMKQELEKLK